MAIAKAKRKTAMKKARSSPARRPATTPMRLFVRDLVLPCRIGVHQHERVADQRIRLNVELGVDLPRPVGDDLDNTLCYGEIMTGIRHVVGGGHVNLIETLAERIAEMCLADPRVQAAKVRIEKLEVFPEATSVGVEIERRRSGR